MNISEFRQQIILLQVKSKPGALIFHFIFHIIRAVFS